jgi:hypothetical protein
MQEIDGKPYQPQPLLLENAQLKSHIIALNHFIETNK